MSYYRHELENGAIAEGKEKHGSQEIAFSTAQPFNLECSNLLWSCQQNNSALSFGGFTKDWYPTADSNNPGNNLEDI